MLAQCSVVHDLSGCQGTTSSFVGALVHRLTAAVASKFHRFERRPEKRLPPRTIITPMDWHHHRRQMMLDPSAINLNTGSFGPLPRCVFDRATALRQQLAAEPMDFLLRKTPDLLWEAR